MMLARMILIAGLVVLAGCGAHGSHVCDEGPYSEAERAARVQSPEGLDSLNPLNEIPLPAASPREPWAEESGCLEHPPQTIKL